MSNRDKYSSGNYISPSQEEIRELLKKYNLTGSQFGNLVGVTSRTVRRWTGGNIDIPYACWRLALIELQEDYNN